jgi:beta-galactosidase
MSGRPGRCAAAMLMLSSLWTSATAAASEERLVLASDLPPGPTRLLGALTIPQRRGALLDAIVDGSCRVAVAPATPATLGALEKHRAELDAFTARGGWVVLWDLERDGLPAFNHLVGYEHLLRPPIMEDVSLPADPDPLIAGLDPSDLIMNSDARGPFGAVLRDPNAWCGVVDGDDIAPFCALPTSEHWGIPGAGYGHDRDPRNLVNGFTDQWYFGFTINVDKPENRLVPMPFPRTEEVVGFTMAPDPIYGRIVRLRLLFPEPENPPIDLRLASEGVEPQEFWFPAVRTAGMTLEIIEVAGTAPQVTGIRNCWIRVRRPPNFAERVRPLLSIGLLDAYPRGRGGLVLDQIRVADAEPAKGARHENDLKQREIMRVLLQHLLGDD